ncbi:pyridoxal-phosphate dependent enzyme [Mesorhizobium sp.]|uniref:pyridoxal-phosphate dependent enzyme n=1 Tax=Mesorhizobium sp. TaxID=1871066 RepID=UPI0011FEACC3|nr:pyridoxal-phosphate dependent enzyme [Mesorhizobium sp.]TIN08615.1 MAG: pyridoxal-phosphate dependent enzyme [Mesorhizobium sp.]
MHAHIADALKAPLIIQLTDRLYIARFEVLKIYSAIGALEQLLKEGLIKQGQTLVDSSSGIYAQALAMACHKYGMRCHIVASQTIDKTLKIQLELLGAVVEQVPSVGGLEMDQRQRVDRIEKLLQKNPGYHWMRQYHDRIHYLGYKAVADLIKTEIDLGGLCLVGGVGSGASTGGLANYLRNETDVQLCGVQPFGSITFGSSHIQDPAALVAGIGSAIPFDNVEYTAYDIVHWISFQGGLAGAVALMKRHAVFAGLSSGCCYLAAQWEEKGGDHERVLMLSADTGHRYVETVFSHRHEADQVDKLSPEQVNAPQQISLPWSRMAWRRRPYELTNS